MRSKFVQGLCLLATPLAMLASSASIRCPQSVTVGYAAHGVLPAMSLSIRQDEKSRLIESIQLVVDGCEVMVPERFFKDLTDPCLSDVGITVAPSMLSPNEFSIYVCFNVFLPCKQGYLKSQQIMLVYENGAITKRIFRIEDEDRLSYEER